MPIHYAFGFNPEQLHDTLRGQVVANGVVDDTLLHDLAVTIVNSLSEPTKFILSRMNYDEWWLTNSDSEVSHSDEWYMINLARNLSRVPSLSNRFIRSHVVLEMALPAGGWNKDDINALIFGKSLRTVLQRSDDQSLFGGFHILGGCLSLEDIQSILSPLEELEEMFTSPSHDAVRLIQEFADYNKQEPANLLRMAFADALEMLNTALSRKEALFLIM